MMMVEWLSDSDPQGGEVSPAGPGRLLVGVAQHQEAGLLLVSAVPHVGCRISDVTVAEPPILHWLGSQTFITASGVKIVFQLYYSSNQPDTLIFNM